MFTVARTRSVSCAAWSPDRPVAPVACGLQSPHGRSSGERIKRVPSLAYPVFLCPESYQLWFPWTVVEDRRKRSREGRDASTPRTRLGLHIKGR